MLAPFRVLRWLLPLLAAPGLVFAATAPAAHPCPPCGDWRLDAGTSDDPEGLVDKALSEYKPPKVRRPRFTPGDIASESEAELQYSLREPPGTRREELREELRRLSRSPAELHIRQDRDDVLIDAGPTERRRVTPGEPHSRVDARGTARIVSRVERNSLVVSESYDSKSENREIYKVDGNALLVTRVMERRGLPKLTIRSRYLPAS